MRLRRIFVGCLGTAGATEVEAAADGGGAAVAAADKSALRFRVAAGVADKEEGAAEYLLLFDADGALSASATHKATAAFIALESVPPVDLEAAV